MPEEMVKIKGHTRYLDILKLCPRSELLVTYESKMRGSRPRGRSEARCVTEECESEDFLLVIPLGNYV